ncbi:ribosome-associated translation inhibitor RaiA [Thiomicrospira microaerophila]|uniref:ribosome hibernation-promoting factor, HPF/YfiA family n=1 Tax=Thiomicrospira microaerophila TaxID=406020 RepID=UPI00200FD3E1|nr:ribosome-associated translation inhibitor RaiA [Thiomicrospira microaerophila]UQB42919.1 ribosome-associated translation inhibitor RaiA [Thiomicrospira microaerophila]
MQINITGHHMDLTDALRDYVNEKFSKLERHFDHVTNVHVILTVEKQGQKAEATVHVSGQDLFAQNETSDMYASIDGLIDKLDRQIIKHKEKISDHHQKSGGVKSMNSAAVEE